MQLWTWTVGCCFVLCIMVHTIRPLFGCGQSETPEIHPEMSYGNSSRQSEYGMGGNTPMYSPYMAGSPGGSPAHDVRLLFFLCYDFTCVESV